MSIQLYNSYSGKYEEISEYFSNKRKEYLRKFETLNSNQIKLWLQVTIKEIQGEIEKNEKMITEVETGVNKSENPQFNKIYEYEPSLVGYMGLLEFLKTECSIRFPDVFQEIFLKKVETKEEKAKGFGHYEDDYFVWTTIQQRLADTVLILQREEKIDKTLTFSKLGDLLPKKFRFQSGKNISHETINTIMGRAGKYKNTTKFDFDTAKEIVLEILLKNDAPEIISKKM